SGRVRGARPRTAPRRSTSSTRWRPTSRSHAARGRCRRAPPIAWNPTPPATRAWSASAFRLFDVGGHEMAPTPPTLRALAKPWRFANAKSIYRRRLVIAASEPEPGQDPFAAAAADGEHGGAFALVLVAHAAQALAGAIGVEGDPAGSEQRRHVGVHLVG